MMNDDMNTVHDAARADCLIARARRGDSAAFRALYELNVRRVHALSLRLVTDRGEAEELTQDVFVAAWREINRYRGDALFSTWLHGITVRLARQRVRSFLRRRRREERLAAEYIDAVSKAMPTANDAGQTVLLLVRRNEELIELRITARTGCGITSLEVSR